MPGEPSSQRPPSSSANAIREFATSNSTSSHFLGATQRSWMTEGRDGPATVPAPRPPLPDANRLGVNNLVHDSHSRSVVTCAGGESEAAPTKTAISSLQNPFTAQTDTSTTNNLGNLKSGHQQSITPTTILASPSQPPNSVTDAGNSLSLQPSTHGLRSISETLTQSSSGPPLHGAPFRNATLSHSSSTGASSGRPSYPTPPTRLDNFQPAESLRFSAGQATSSIMVPSPQNTQAIIRPATQFPYAMNPVPAQHVQAARPPIAQLPDTTSPIPAQISTTTSRKRPGEPQDEERRTRSRSNGIAASRMPTASTAPTDPSGPDWSIQLSEAADILRQNAVMNVTDQSRLKLLIDAFKKKDVMFMMLHQVYCAYSDQSTILGVLNFTKPEFDGLAQLSPILVSNALLSRGALVLFINSPQPIDCLLAPLGTPTAKLLSIVRVFLAAFGTQYEVRRLTCIARGYPPSTMELVYALSLESPIMQRTLYSSIHRQIRGVDKDLFNHAAELFQHDQEQFALYSGPLTDNIVAEQSQRFGRLYMRLPLPSSQSHDTNQQPLPPSRRASAHSPVNSHFAPTSSRLPAAAHFLPSQPIGQSQEARHAAGPAFPYPRGTVSQHLAGQYAHQSPPVMHAPIANGPMRARSSVARNPPQPQIQQPQPPRTVNKTQLDDSLLPLPGVPVVLATNPNPTRVALHQAHLRSPVPRKLDLTGNDTPDVRLYQYAIGFVLEPQKVEATTTYKEWQFNVDPANSSRAAQDVALSEFHPDRKVRFYIPGSFLFRLKAMTRPAGQVTPLSSSDFNVAPTTWPQYCFVSINEVDDVEFRRRQLHGRDLAADLTHVIRAGQNLIRLSNHGIKEESNKVFFFAIECIHIADHTTVTQMTTKLPAVESLASITAALTESQDDEISFADPVVSIDLIDPFMATVWHTPVRGKDCKHRECFDQQAFLMSRTSKVKNGPTSPDQWMCPICKKDARPQNLILDEFMVQVRQELETRNQFDARAILVKQDGTWEAKFDKDKKDAATTHARSWTQGAAEELSRIDLNGTAREEANTPNDQPDVMTTAVSTPKSATPAKVPTETTIIEIDD